MSINAATMLNGELIFRSREVIDSEDKGPRRRQQVSCGSQVFRTNVRRSPSPLPAHSTAMQLVRNKEWCRKSRRFPERRRNHQEGCLSPKARLRNLRVVEAWQTETDLAET